MRINYFPGAEEPKEKHFGQKKKKLDVAAKIDAAIKEALDELETHPERRCAFLRLLACVRAQTQLLKPTEGQGSVGWNAPVFLIKRLKNVASRQALWLRPVETWCAAGGSLRQEFRSLVQHLFAVYSVPAFMDSVWDLPAGAEAFRRQAWFIRLGRGARLRSLNLPIVLTRSMEHHVRGAPEHFTVLEALRYGETRGLGGSYELACAVAGSRLGRDPSNGAFWRTVLRFLVTHPEISLSYVSPILDFIQANKFAGEQILSPNGVETRAASWPEFAMEGRTPNSLLRLVRSWNLQLDGRSSSGFSWEESGFEAFRFIEKRPDGPDLDWSVVELLNSSALHAEGRAVHHCVFSYANKCHRQETTIWSLRLRVDVEEKRKATIEVDPRSHTIVQVRAERNRRPGAGARRTIGLWAAPAGLHYDPRA